MIDRYVYVYQGKGGEKHTLRELYPGQGIEPLESLFFFAVELVVGDYCFWAFNPPQVIYSMVKRSGKAK